MVNSAGEEFFNQQQDDPLAYGPYTVQLKALAKQVHAGKARYGGGYYAGFDHCDAREVEAYTSYGKGFRQLGLHFPEQLVEVAVTAHYRQGGIDVDTKTMRSSVPGLYVAGGLGGHSNGLIGLATYDGRVVAEGVMGDLAQLPLGVLCEADVKSEALRLENLLRSRRDGIPVSQVKAAIRQTMWDKVGVEKDAASLQSALVDIAAIRLDLMPRMSVVRAEKSLNYEWLDAIDAVNMVDTCHRSSARKAADHSCGAIFRCRTIRAGWPPTSWSTPVTSIASSCARTTCRSSSRILRSQRDISERNRMGPNARMVRVYKRINKLGHLPLKGGGRRAKLAGWGSNAAKKSSKDPPPDRLASLRRVADASRRRPWH